MKEELPKGFSKSPQGKTELGKEGGEGKTLTAEEESKPVKGEDSEKGEESSGGAVSEPPSEGNVTTAAAAGLAAAAVKAKVRH